MLGVIGKVPLEIHGTTFYVEFVVLPCKQPVLMGEPFHARHVSKVSFHNNAYTLTDVPLHPDKSPEAAFIVPATTHVTWLMGPNG